MIKDVETGIAGTAVSEDGDEHAEREADKSIRLKIISVNETIRMRDRCRQ